MSVKYILSRVGAKMGLNPSDQEQRNVMLAFLNEATEEIFDQSDLVGSLIEQVFRVNGDQTISLPATVGTVRAIREYQSQVPWHINQLRPRYNEYNWRDAWRNIRLKNDMALMTSVTNQAEGIITVPEVESPPIVVSVSGPTQQAASISEDLTMDTVSKSTVNQFLDYTSVKKDRVNNFDVTLSDVDGKLLTVIPNNSLKANYQILDVSLAPWLPFPTSSFDNYMEILYKVRLPYLSNDDDEFLTGRYDNILVNKVLQLWGEEQGKSDMALAYDQKATRTLARRNEEQNRETEDMVALVANPHDTIHRKIGVGLRRRYSFYTGRKF